MTDYAQIKLEAGPAATPFKLRQIGQELALCRRYYREFDAYVPSAGEERSMPIDMRAAPTISGGGAGFSSTGTTAETLIFEQTTGAVQTLKLDAEL